MASRFCPTTPPQAFAYDGLGSSPFARRYSGNLILISFPRGTKMFQFPRSPLACLLNSACDARSSTRRVAPFGNPRIFACLRLPVAFRSLPRPSSAPVPRHPPCALPSLDLHRQTLHSAFPSAFSLFTCQAASFLVGLGGLEPPTLRLSGVRSNHLSYKPIYHWWR